MFCVDFMTIPSLLRMPCWCQTSQHHVSEGKIYPEFDERDTDPHPDSEKPAAGPSNNPLGQSVMAICPLDDYHKAVVMKP